MTQTFIYIDMINTDMVSFDFSHMKNMGIATKFILIPCVVIEMLTNTVISVMAAVICIFSVNSNRNSNKWLNLII
jgi:hypothetical protein